MRGMNKTNLHYNPHRKQSPMREAKVLALMSKYEYTELRTFMLDHFHDFPKGMRLTLLNMYYHVYNKHYNGNRSNVTRCYGNDNGSSIYQRRLRDE